MDIDFDLQRAADNERMLRSQSAQFTSIVNSVTPLGTTFGVSSFTSPIISKATQLKEAATSCAEMLRLLQLVARCDGEGSVFQLELMNQLAASLQMVQGDPYAQVRDMSPAEVEDFIADHPDFARFLDSLSAEDRAAVVNKMRPETALKLLDGQDAVDYFNSLPADARAKLIEEWPEYVAAKVLAVGGELSADELDALDSANSYTTLSIEYWAKFGLKIPLQAVTIKVDEKLSAVVKLESDGKVHVYVTTRGDVAIGADDKSSNTGAYGGGFGEATTVFEFDNQADAAAAVEALRHAAASVASSMLKPPSWKEVAIGILSPPAVLGNRLHNALTKDQVDDVLGKWGTAIDEVTVKIGSEGELTVESPEAQSAAAIATGSASVKVSTYSYVTLDPNGHDDVVGFGVSGEGSFSLEGSQNPFGADLGLPTGVAGTGTVSAEVHAYPERPDEENLEAAFHIDLSAEATGGVSTSNEAVSVEGKTDRAISIDITVPINSSTRQQVDQAISAIRNGANVEDALAGLYNAADVRITTTSGNSQTTKVTVGPATGEVGDSSSTTESSKHKRPGGEMYDEPTVDQHIDDARG